MRFKRTGNYATALALPLVGLFIAGVEAIIIAHVIEQARSVHPQIILSMISGLFWLVLIVAPVVLIFAPFRLIRRERMLRAAARDDDEHAPLATTQPNPDEALAAGTTITLTRSARAGSLAIIILGACITMVLFALVSEVGLIQFVPAVPTWLTRAIFPVRYLPMPPFPAPLDWLTSAYPVAFSVVLGLVIVWRGMSRRWYAISANDGGISLRRSLHRPRFIPWNDIDVFLQMPQRTGDTFIDTFLLHGTAHSLTFFLTGAYWEEAFFVHPSGYVRYAADARALLATVVARSYTPLRLCDKTALTQPSPVYLRVAKTSTPAIAADAPPLTEVLGASDVDVSATTPALSETTTAVPLATSDIPTDEAATD